MNDENIKSILWDRMNDLEMECRKLVEENEQLKKELAPYREKQKMLAAMNRAFDRIEALSDEEFVAELDAMGWPRNEDGDVNE